MHNSEPQVGVIREASRAGAAAAARVAERAGAAAAARPSQAAGSAATVELVIIFVRIRVRILAVARPVGARLLKRAHHTRQCRVRHRLKSRYPEPFFRNRLHPNKLEQRGGAWQSARAEPTAIGQLQVWQGGAVTCCPGHDSPDLQFVATVGAIAP